MERVVADTSVLISAFLSKKGDSFKFVRLLLQNKLENYTSEAILDEFLRVLMTKISKFYPVELLIEFYQLIKANSKLVTPEEKFEICRDKTDNIFLEVTFFSKADCLLTLDNDLLDLRDKNKEFEIKGRKFKILKPEEFLTETGFTEAETST